MPLSVDDKQTHEILLPPLFLEADIVVSSEFFLNSGMHHASII